MNPVGVLLGAIAVIFLVANGPQMVREARDAASAALSAVDEKAASATTEVAQTVEDKIAAVDEKARQLSDRIDAKVREMDAAVSQAADELADKKAKAEAELAEKARAALPFRP